jgi:hypothetical protein
LNEALLLRLAAEFQGFARDLHELSCDVFASWISPSDPTVQQVVRKQLANSRELERGNAHPGSIGSDFGRFGFDVWPALAIRNPHTARHNRTLQLLNDARNSIAHADEAKLLKLRAEGFPLVLGTYRRWRRDLDGLAANLDGETATQLGRLFQRQGPWGETMATTSKRLKMGDKVAVPWGLDEIVGEVLEVYGPPARRYAKVRVPIHGPAGETLQEEDIPFPEDALRIVTAV